MSLERRVRISEHGWIVDDAGRQVSVNFDSRPEGCDVVAIIIHSISLPLGSYGTNFISQLFTNELNCQLNPAFEDLQELRVSAHFLVKRCGSIIQFVSTEQRAWHAGKSFCLGREGVNDFSIGIELEGCDYESFTRQQYKNLAELIRAVRWQYPKIRKSNCFGHIDIAPDRKTDPGPFFSWARFYALMQ